MNAIVPIALINDGVEEEAVAAAAAAAMILPPPPPSLFSRLSCYLCFLSEILIALPLHILNIAVGVPCYILVVMFGLLLRLLSIEACASFATLVAEEMAAYQLHAIANAVTQVGHVAVANRRLLDATNLVSL
jgi:hypothetical protein